ncbi:Taurine catabolism dioxygenase TauD/TfdA [Penicillium cf. griseofulvum]|uniref:Taurine catabolism dioxygenase TauD/TfdA n=1 Tax=Penicillium cf. griseofulvum TaxID=2972120 RepID=A0A9W9T0W6_9EURO|nr:Taurine catabolism dioxygenase TauD/TfdA [Penicillium cf. griseofulvum]
MESQNIQHVQQIDQHLKDSGFLKISLKFDDDECNYLQQLILQLHKNHAHGLPITHSSSKGWLWDVKPMPAALANATTNQARSETMSNFPWHTDCSYEVSPPRYFALQVLHEDRCGGGTLSILDSARLMSLLSPQTRLTLTQPEFRITVPPEFIKDENKTHITGSVIWVDKNMGKVHLRLRSDIIEPLTKCAKSALEELQRVLNSTEINAQVVDLTPEILPRGSIVMIDNRRWLHARNVVRDPSRHLRRVRWDVRPFGEM